LEVESITLEGEQGDPAGTIKVTAHFRDGTSDKLISTCANSIYHWVRLDSPDIIRSAPIPVLFSEEDIYRISEQSRTQVKQFDLGSKEEEDEARLEQQWRVDGIKEGLEISNDRAINIDQLMKVVENRLKYHFNETEDDWIPIIQDFYKSLIEVIKYRV